MAFSSFDLFIPFSQATMLSQECLSANPSRLSPPADLHEPRREQVRVALHGQGSEGMGKSPPALLHHGKQSTREVTL